MADNVYRSACYYEAYAGATINEAAAGVLKMCRKQLENGEQVKLVFNDRVIHLHRGSTMYSVIAEYEEALASRSRAPERRRKFCSYCGEPLDGEVRP